jgi:uncharacterized protein YwqG
MNAQDVTKMFEPWRERYRRTAFQPAVRNGSVDGVLSWFGGEPSGPLDQAWPQCSQCKVPMRFFLQIALAEVPPSASLPIRSGVLQLFYCATDDGACETWQPFSGAHFARIVDEPTGLALAPQGNALAKKSVIAWNPTKDYPHPEDHEELGLSYDYDFKNNRVSVRSVDPPLELSNVDLRVEVAEAIAMAAPGDKIGGWPHWVQTAEYPSCPECGTKMSLLLQVDSEDNLEYMFGDAGCAHLTFCTEHPRVFGFGWACG